MLGSSGTRAALHGARALTLALLGLALGAAALLALAPLQRITLARWGLLLLVPLTVGALATLFEPAPRSPRFPALVPMPTPAHLPLVLALVACDLGGIALAISAGLAEGAQRAPFSLRWTLALVLGGPVVVAAMTLGWEWGLRQRLFGALEKIGRPRGGALLSIVAGTALALPIVAPGFQGPPLETALALAAAAALREATALRLFRRAGILLSGSYRGALAVLDALVVADAATFWLPAVRYQASGGAGQAARLLGPLAALVVAGWWAGRLDRLDRERRLRP